MLFHPLTLYFVLHYNPIRCIYNQRSRSPFKVKYPEKLSNSITSIYHSFLWLLWALSSCIIFNGLVPFWCYTRNLVTKGLSKFLYFSDVIVSYILSLFGLRSCIWTQEQDESHILCSTKGSVMAKPSSKKEKSQLCFSGIELKYILVHIVLIKKIYEYTVHVCNRMVANFFVRHSFYWGMLFILSLFSLIHVKLLCML